MSNYTDDSRSCRVDFWKPNGKWYTTEAIQFRTYRGSPHDAFKEALRFTGVGGRLGRYVGMTATCLEPYHEHSHPISLVVPEEW